MNSREPSKESRHLCNCKLMGKQIKRKQISREADLKKKIKTKNPRM